MHPFRSQLHRMNYLLPTGSEREKDPGDGRKDVARNYLTMLPGEKVLSCVVK